MAALFPLARPCADPKTALETAAVLAEDSGTVASVVGQILGAAGHDVPNADSLIDIDLDHLAARLATIPFRTD